MNDEQSRSVSGGDGPAATTTSAESKVEVDPAPQGGEDSRQAGGNEGPADPAPGKIKYTSRVRRGFGIFVMQNMEERAKELRAWNEAKPRNERRYTSKQLDDLDIAVAYMRQEAEGVEE